MSSALKPHLIFFLVCFLFFFYRSRADYLSQLMKDLCMYYSYNEYLMEKLYHLFPSEVNKT